MHSQTVIYKNEMNEKEEVLKRVFTRELQNYAKFYSDLKRIIHAAPTHGNYQIDAYNRYVKIVQLVMDFDGD